MKTIKKIFMVIALIILTPTVLLVAFILIADATDMNLKEIVEGKEAETEVLTGDMTLPVPDLNFPPAQAPDSGQINDPVQTEGNHLAANPPADWQTAGNNSALQWQLNNDAWVASPSSRPTVSGNTSENTNIQDLNLPDPDKYMKAYLDAVYRNSPNAYIEYKIGTAEEAQELYEEALDEDTINDIFGSLGFSDVQADERMELIRRILANVRYQVGEAKKQDDGSYIVNITYEKMNVYMPTVDAYIKRAENMIAGWNRDGEAGRETPSYESMNEQLITVYTECLSEALRNADYDSSQNATIRLRVVNGAYELDNTDAAKFEELLTDSKAAMEKLDKAVSGWNF